MLGESWRCSWQEGCKEQEGLSDYPAADRNYLLMDVSANEVLGNVDGPEVTKQAISVKSINGFGSGQLGLDLVVLVEYEADIQCKVREKGLGTLIWASESTLHVLV